MRRPLSSSPSSGRELYLFTSKQPSLSSCLLSSVISCKRSQRNTFKEFRTLKFPPPSSKKKLSGRFVRSSFFSCLRAQDRGGTFSLKDKALNSSKICVFTKKKKRPHKLFVMHANIIPSIVALVSIKPADTIHSVWSRSGLQGSTIDSDAPALIASKVSGFGCHGISNCAH